MESFSCCRQEHAVQVGNIRIVQVLSSMFQAKFRNLLHVAPAMAFVSLGLEVTLYAGSEEFAEAFAREEFETAEAFAATIGFEELLQFLV